MGVPSDPLFDNQPRLCSFDVEHDCLPPTADGTVLPITKSGTATPFHTLQCRPLKGRLSKNLRDAHG